MNAPPPENIESRCRLMWRCSLVFVVALAAYFPALRDGFVWNDPDYVTRPELQSVRGLGRIWFEVGATEQYYPVLHTAFWIEHRVWGDTALDYHLANVLLHALAACLFVLILRRLAVPGAWLGGLLFALHPICAESVVWIAEQKNTLSTVFYLAAALAYLGWREEKGGWFRYSLATGLFILACLSKSVTATLPAALLVVAWWQRGRLELRRDVAPLLPWFVVGIADGLFTAWVERTSIGAEGPAFALSFLQRGLVAGHVIWFYLGKLVWPSRLMFFYPRWTIDPASAWNYLYPLAVVAALAVLWRLRRSNRGPLAAALLFVGTLFPVLGFFNVYAFVFSFVADHFAYLASFSAFGLMAAGWGWWAAADRSVVPRAAAVIALGFFGLLTWRQCGRYHDLVTFYCAILDENPASSLAHYNLGNLLREAGHTDEAIGHYEQALKLEPDQPQIENNLGLALFEEGRTQDAIVHYRASIHLRPSYAQAHNNLGIALRAMQQNDEAIREYGEALKLQPGYAEAAYNLGLALKISGRNDEAMAAFERAQRLQPGSAAFHKIFGAALAEAGRVGEAIIQFQEEVRLAPTDASAHLDLAVALRMAGRTQEALRQYEEVRRLTNPAGDSSNAVGR